MGDPVRGVAEGFDELSLDEQLQLLEELWQRVAPRLDAADLPMEHRRVIEERLRDMERHPEAEAPAAEVMKRLRAELTSE